jgi:NAD-dependent SIR2 family protein deacetylase
MEELECKKCGSKEYTTTKVGQHLKAECKKCGAFIKHVAQLNPDTVHIIPVGKYKGEKVNEATDKSYLLWMLSNIKLSFGLKTAIENRIKNLN